MKGIKDEMMKKWTDVYPWKLFRPSAQVWDHTVMFCVSQNKELFQYSVKNQ